MGARQLYDEPLPIVSAPMAGVSDPITKAPTTTSQVLADANPARAGGVLTTTSSLPVFVRFGTTTAAPAAGGFHLVLAAGVPVVVPPGITGQIHIVVAGLATGLVAFTEWLK